MFLNVLFILKSGRIQYIALMEGENRLITPKAFSISMIQICINMTLISLTFGNFTFFLGSARIFNVCVR